jgi:hypothetical protein
LSGVERFIREIEVSGSYPRINVAESRGLFGNPEDRGMSAVGSRYQRNGKTQQSEDLVSDILNCRLCRPINCYCSL